MISSAFTLCRFPFPEEGRSAKAASSSSAAALKAKRGCHLCVLLQIHFLTRSRRNGLFVNGSHELPFLASIKQSKKTWKKKSLELHFSWTTFSIDIGIKINNTKNINRKIIVRTHYLFSSDISVLDMIQ